MPRTLVWFSACAPSAVAAKLVLGHRAPKWVTEDVVIAYTDPGSEHPDNLRFISDCERWFGQEVLMLRSDIYKDTWDVWNKTRFLVGPTGARCTADLKRGVRFKFERPDDVQVFGFTIEEEHRAVRFREQNPGVDLRTPLIDAGLTKPECLAMVERAGLELPAMYHLGFKYNNCIGCVKGGIGYWNHIRIHFPDTFDKMALLEREIDHAILSEEVTEGSRKKSPVWLDELDPTRGNHADEPDIECGILCAIAEEAILP